MTEFKHEAATYYSREFTVAIGFFFLVRWDWTLKSLEKLIYKDCQAVSDLNENVDTKKMNMTELFHKNISVSIYKHTRNKPKIEKILMIKEINEDMDSLELKIQ